MFILKKIFKEKILQKKKTQILPAVKNQGINKLSKKKTVKSQNIKLSKMINKEVAKLFLK